MKLEPKINCSLEPSNTLVATALTACGIETQHTHHLSTELYVATALTACGIETRDQSTIVRPKHHHEVATALTACGIETIQRQRVYRL